MARNAKAAARSPTVTPLLVPTIRAAPWQPDLIWLPCASTPRVALQVGARRGQARAKCERELGGFHRLVQHRPREASQEGRNSRHGRGACRHREALAVARLV